ncbi:hypothetical protein PHET_08238 [Paragonimus heterotremus]|uniref:Uncharacterized protein n=1 Tax=Paragonimus heterotremus TaxID=100268 RepID=A0A8J4WGI5_9TREM|nr:hypothetical protein PHET_08238 [Paragonimus heterotremus]
MVMPKCLFVWSVHRPFDLGCIRLTIELHMVVYLFHSKNDLSVPIRRKHFALSYLAPSLPYLSHSQLGVGK